MRIAVIGSGVAGLVAAHRLHSRHDVTLFEADPRIGGHVNTVDVEVDGRPHTVDTGFIVYNEPNYPGFAALLVELGVETQPAEMSFGVADPASGLEYRASNLNSLFAQRRNLVNPEFLRLLADLGRFNRAAGRLVAHEARWTGRDRLPSTAPGDDETLADFLRRGNYSDAFVRRFLVPFGAAIWSADPVSFTEFPVRAYARFMANHGLLQFAGRPQWRTITGGARRYVDALVEPFADRVRTSTPVHKLVRRPHADGRPAVEVLTEQRLEVFDRVIVATHSDQALRLLADPTPTEQKILGAIRYQRNVATLHTDARMLPRNRRARASWNYAVDARSGRATVTYWMNRLQAIESRRPLLVTLNRADEIDEREVLAEFVYQHPVFDRSALAAQRRRHELRGGGIEFAGAYWGYGFHEDGVQSALEVVHAVECAP